MNLDSLIIGPHRLVADNLFDTPLLVPGGCLMSPKDVSEPTALSYIIILLPDFLKQEIAADYGPSQ